MLSTFIVPFEVKSAIQNLHVIPLSIVFHIKQCQEGWTLLTGVNENTFTCVLWQCMTFWKSTCLGEVHVLCHKVYHFLSVFIFLFTSAKSYPELCQNILCSQWKKSLTLGFVMISFFCSCLQLSWMLIYVVFQKLHHAMHHISCNKKYLHSTNHSLFPL